MRNVIITLVAVLIMVLGAIAVTVYILSGSKSPQAARYAGGDVVKATGAIRSAGRRQSPGRRGRPSDFSKNPESFYEKGELMVSNPPKNFLSIAGRLGFSVLEKVRLAELGLTLYRMATPSGKTVIEARAMLARRVPGLNVDVNQHFQAQQGVIKATVRSLVGWAKYPTYCGRGIKIGMVDAAVDVNHPALKGQKITFRSFHRRDRRMGPADHGTAVATIIAGKPGWGGLLPGASLYAANMFERDETGKVVGNGMALLKGLNWLVGKGIKVINMSIAGADNKVIRRVLKRVAAKGVVMVAAAGNWGPRAKPAYPAAYREVVAVTAFNDRKLIYFSANNGSYIDFAAPGVQIWTAVPGGGKFQSGTSFASPYVAALTASEISRGVRSTPDSVRADLRKNVIDMGKKGKDRVFGWGFILKSPRC
jgi:subtilisin family serine protease